MKYSAKLILATFNSSKSGKSLIKIEGDTMFVVNSNVAAMCKSGEISEVEFAEGTPLMDQADPSKVAFKTMQVKDFTESALNRIEQAKRFVDAAEGVDQDKFKAAIALAKDLKF